MASPLGLIGLNLDDGIPSVNGGNRQYLVVNNKAVKSLFGEAQFSPYPSTYNKSTGSVDKIKAAADIHKDEANDISIADIIEYTNKPGHESMKLDYAHFAYLKKVGVYPNNRLIIARRFSSGVGNDLTEIPGRPLSTLVSYFSDEEDTFQITFGEEWANAEGGFEDVLNDIGEDILQGDNKGGKLGTSISNAFNIIPLPALTEGLQLEVMNAMGLAGTGQGSGKSPYGNPNIIREAKQRKMLGKSEAGSGLKAEFTINMKIEYEQKFINGIDPTLVYMDIIQNALTFGTSEAAFQYSSAFAAGTTGLIANLLSGNYKAIINSVKAFVESLIGAIAKKVKEFVNYLVELENAKPAPDANKDNKDDRQEAINKIVAAGDVLLQQLFKVSVGTVISKYKIRLLGITHALTGSPSAPWHVTLGNPKKPIFSSGDLVCSDVKLTLGKVLAFNDLPSSIMLELSFKNARSLGAQEIFNRLNTGKGRSYTRFRKSFVELNDAEIEKEDKDKINQENKNKNGETQPTGGSASQTPPSKPVEKNTVNNTNDQPKIEDDYVLDFTSEGLQSKSTTSVVGWGKKQSEPPKNDTAKVGDNTTGTFSNDSQAKASNQSANDPNTTTAGTPTGSSQSTAGTAETPGITASTGQSGAPQPENVPAQSEEWVAGKKVTSGSYNQGNIRVEWEVRQDTTKGYYEAIVEGESEGTADSIEGARQIAREEAAYLFEQQGGKL